MTSMVKQTFASCWFVLAAILAIFAAPAFAQTASDYVQSATTISASQVKISFKPTTPSTLVDVHYNVPGLPEQSFRMTNNAGTWEQTISNLSTGAQVEYWFTYEKQGPLYVTPHFFYTLGTSSGGTVATPAFSPGTGTYTGAQSVTITTATAGATIRYTNNGTTPTATSTQYTGPISVTASQTLKAIAIKTGSANSAIATATYTIQSSTVVATPVFTPAGGTYSSAQSVAITTATTGATIRYTVDGTTPTANSTQYAGPISVAASKTLKAIGIKSGMTNSAVATSSYVIGTQQAGNGRFPIYFVNKTTGRWNDDQIFIYGLSLNESNQWCHMLADGTLVPVNPADENAPNHLTKNGRNYANYAFTLAQAKASNFRSPTYVRGGRLYISVGTSVYIPIGVNAWGGPDLLNPNDPNADVYYDWYEYTYVYNTDVAFGGNTGMVDQFGIPLTHRVVNAALGIDSTKGTTGTRDQIMANYNAAVPAAFRGLASQYRIKAPYKDSFRPGFANQNYLQSYIDQVWNQYSIQEMRLQRLGDLFVGKVVSGRFQFTKNGIGPFFIDKPTTFDVFACSGNFAKGSDTEKELEAEFCGAFNRGVAQNTANWANPSAYYQNSPMQNEYARFWHQNGINGKAYAFAYDDTNDQSSVIIIPNLSSHPYPDSVTITIGW